MRAILRRPHTPIRLFASTRRVCTTTPASASTLHITSSAFPNLCPSPPLEERCGAAATPVTPAGARSCYSRSFPASTSTYTRTQGAGALATSARAFATSAPRHSTSPVRAEEEEGTPTTAMSSSHSARRRRHGEDSEEDDHAPSVSTAAIPKATLYRTVAQRLALPPPAVRYVLEQTKEGATVPFLARYRQDNTGHMTEDVLRAVLDTAEEVAAVHQRRQFMLKSLEQRGLLTPELLAAFQQMVHLSQLEDAWEPFKERKTSLAARGREAGLGPLAQQLLQACEPLPDLRCAVQAVEDGERLLEAIVAEELQRDEGLRRELLAYVRDTGVLHYTLVAAARKKAAKELRPEDFEQLRKKFQFYDGKRYRVSTVESHVVLATSRGEAKGALQVQLEVGPNASHLFAQSVRRRFPGVQYRLTPARTTDGHDPSPHGPTAYERGLLRASLVAAREHYLKAATTSVRRDLLKSAAQEAILVFAHNARQMLLQRPMAKARVLAMDPGLSNGVKCVALDEDGNVLTFFRCTLMEEDRMRAFVRKVVETKRLNKVVIGNGTASYRTAALVARVIKESGWREVEFAVVSEAGASVYSVSDIAKEEFPQLDIMYRGAVSIGRRVLDPLSEFVKIPVRSMGIGMYQHDVPEKELLRELGRVVESCVAQVGVNATSANRYVMERVPGIQKRIVDQIVLARHAKQLHSREDLRRVPGMTEAVYTQIAGFFRFPHSPEPLDATNLHPESYAAVRRLLAAHADGRLGTKDEEEGEAGARQAVGRALAGMDEAALRALAAREGLDCGVETLRLVRQELLQPAADPRASLPHAGLLRREVLRTEDLQQGQVLEGVVGSVTTFGVFVDCGLHDSVLVRGPGTDRLQLGALVRARFEGLDHLRRPRVTYLPDPAAAEGSSGGGGRVGGAAQGRFESEHYLPAAAGMEGLRETLVQQKRQREADNGSHSPPLSPHLHPTTKGTSSEEEQDGRAVKVARREASENSSNNKDRTEQVKGRTAVSATTATTPLSASPKTPTTTPTAASDDVDADVAAIIEDRLTASADAKKKKNKSSSEGEEEEGTVPAQRKKRTTKKVAAAAAAAKREKPARTTTARKTRTTAKAKKTTTTTTAAAAKKKREAEEEETEDVTPMEFHF